MIKIRNLFFYLALSMSAILIGQNKSIFPGEVWNDTNGNPINAHGGGMLFHEGTYYWYGEIKNGETSKVERIRSWECYRTKAGGVSCYSSKNLLDWKYEGVALSPNTTDEGHDLHISKVIERPKVIYNNKTKMFVMWLHVDSEDYSFAKTGIAISDNPTGPFKYLKSLRPNGYMSRDMTLFKDTNGKAYHIYSSEDNASTHINLLSDNYLEPTDKLERIFIDQYREAPAMFNHNGTYYLITSGCTGWAPNQAMLASSKSIFGPWENLGNPCHGESSNTTFMSQSTYVFQVDGKHNAYIFMADRWNKTDLRDSRYIWLPLKVTDEEISLQWLDSFDLNYFNP